MAGARRAQKRGRDGHTDGREIHALRGTKRERKGGARGSPSTRPAGRETDLFSANIPNHERPEVIARQSQAEIRHTSRTERATRHRRLEADGGKAKSTEQAASVSAPAGTLIRPYEPGADLLRRRDHARERHTPAGSEQVGALLPRLGPVRRLWGREVAFYSGFQ